MTQLIAGTMEDLIEITERVGLRKQARRRKAYTYMSGGCPKYEGGDYWSYWRGDSGWDNYGSVFLRALLAKMDYVTNIIRRRIAAGKAAIGGLTTIWKDHSL